MAWTPAGNIRGPQGIQGPTGANGSTGPAGSPLPRVASISSSATPAFNVGAADVLVITALAANVTSFTSGLSGTPADEQRIMYRIKGSAARALVWGSAFAASGSVALPTTTAAGRTHRFGFIYNAAIAKWVIYAADAVGF